MRWKRTRGDEKGKEVKDETEKRNADIKKRRERSY